MNSDHENAKRHLNSFVILKKLSWALCAVAFVFGAVLFALGHSAADDLLRVACLGFILACIFSNAAGYQFNRLSIIDLQKQLSELDVGSAKDSKDES